MAKEKQVNYTQAMVDQMVAIYAAAGTETGEAGDKARQDALEKIQAQTGKSLHSVRAKLGQVGVYIAKAQAKAKGTNVTKAELIAQVADNDPAKHEGFFDSLESCTKTVIKYVIGLQNDRNEALAFEVEDGENAS